MTALLRVIFVFLNVYLKKNEDLKIKALKIKNLKKEHNFKARSREE